MWEEYQIKLFQLLFPLVLLAPSPVPCLKGGSSAASHNSDLGDKKYVCTGATDRVHLIREGVTKETIVPASLRLDFTVNREAWMRELQGYALKQMKLPPPELKSVFIIQRPLGKGRSIHVFLLTPCSNFSYSVSIFLGTLSTLLTCVPL